MPIDTSNRMKSCRMANAALAGALVLASCASGERSVATYPTAQEQAAATPLPSVAVGPKLASPQAIWTLRSALNVAALTCPGRAVADRYNQMLKRNKSLFADAYAAEQERYRRSYGATWQARQDRDMTALYNGYANPDGKQRLCSAAEAISAEAASVAEDRFGYFAADALARLDGRAVETASRSR